MAGRRSKFNDRRMDKIVTALKDGATRKAAYDSVPISHETFYNWLNSIPEFLESVTAAEAAFELSMTAVVVKAAKSDPKYALEVLKRRRRTEWGDSQRVDVRQLSNEQLMALLEAEGASPAEAG